MAPLRTKQGASLQLIIAVANDDASPFDLTTVVVSAEVRTVSANALVDTLTLTPNATAGQLTVLQATDAWPVGNLNCDLKFVSVSTGVVMKTQTFSIIVDTAVTA